MSDDYQIYLPASFQELYVTPGRIKPNVSRRELMARYELCEDLATQLTDYARNLQFDLGLSEDVVLTRCRQGLLAEPSVVTPPEAIWVTRRTAELLGWDCPAFEA
jgi:hypothetical protein